MASPPSFQIYGIVRRIVPEGLRLEERRVSLRINVLHQNTRRLHFSAYQEFNLTHFEELAYDVSMFVYYYLFGLLSNNDIQSFSSSIIFFAQQSRPLASDPNLLGVLRFDGSYQDDPEVIDNQIVEESMQQVSMVPTMETAVASLKELKLDDEKAKGERCSICLENFVDDNNALSMPCDHIFHNKCIVQWLRTSHMCPLCRFQMPVE